MSEGQKKPEPGQLGKTIAEGFIHSQRMSHAGIVVTAAAILDQALEEAIKTKLPTLGKKLSKKIFEDFGALSSFSAKIDIAYALDILSEPIYVELQKIRKIRNTFSHSRKILSLDTEPVKSLFYELKRPEGVTGNYAEQFMACILVIDDFLELYLLGMGGDRGIVREKYTKEGPRRSA